MKIAFVTQWFDPEVGSAAIPGAMVRSLQNLGHEVEVITGFPNYPHGKMYPGYSIKLYHREVRDGVTVHRVPLYPNHDHSALRRVLNFLSFMLSASTLGAIRARKADVVLVYSTPGTVGLVGIVARRLFRRPFLLYVQDVWPDTVTATGMLPSWLTRPTTWVLGRFCDAVYRSAVRIAVISPGMKELLVSRGVPEAKVEVIYNWVDETRFYPCTSSRDPERFEIMYAGSIGGVQGLDVAIRALAATPSDSGIVLRFIGSGVAAEELQRLSEELGISHRVLFEGSRDLSEMAEVMASAHAQLVCLKDLPLFRITMPSKIQAILASGAPIVVSAPGDAADLVAESGAGIATSAGDAEELAKAFLWLRSLSACELDALGKAGRAFYEARLCAGVGARRLERALEESAKGNVACPH